MEQFAPHPRAQFEGYYSKFDLPSGSRVALIICTIPKAPERRHMISFTYTPPHTNEYFQREIWADEMVMTRTSGGNSFELVAPGIGSMTVDDNSITSYSIEHKDFSFSGKTTSHLPWSSSTDTPEGPLVHLPLPLHWHVHSPASSCDFRLSIPSFAHLQPEDKAGIALVHQEKNWANSFPSAHIWVQARKGDPPSVGGDGSVLKQDEQYHSICIAGGQILGTEAYLLGYRSNAHPSAASSRSRMYELDFRPPFALRLLSTSPTLSIKPDFDSRTFSLSARNWWTRIDVEAKALAETFFPLSSPFPEGHRENFLAQSFKADIKLKVWEWAWGNRWWDVRGWWTGGGDESTQDVGKWVLKEETDFSNGSLEFGGAYYGFAGSKTRRGR